MTLLVSERCCNQCLFTDRKIVSDRRREQILEECSDRNTHFACHKGTIANQDIVCRGFYETGGSTLVRMARHFNQIEFVDVEKLERKR